MVRHWIWSNGVFMQNKPELICFDLDGTLYQDRVIYPRIITHFFEDTPYRDWIGEVQETIEACLQGQGPLRCGQFVPKQKAEAPQSVRELFAVPAETALLLPDPAPYLDRSRYSYLCDGWTFSMYLARRIGWEGEAFWTRFRRARKDLVNPAYGPAPDQALVDVLAGLRRAGIRLVLCSNAAEQGGRELLDYLGLSDSFDAILFDADKPHSFPQRIRDWGVSPDKVLFIGDQGYYDLYAGAGRGAATWLLSPYEVADAALWDVRLHTLEELKEALKDWTA